MSEQLTLFPVSAVGPIVLQHWPMTRYDGMVGDQMGHGYPVAYHPAACDRAGCHHALVRHAHGNRRRPCEIPRCPCAGYRATPTVRHADGAHHVVPKAAR